jgi:hypothetical protein
MPFWTNHGLLLPAGGFGGFGRSARLWIALGAGVCFVGQVREQCGAVVFVDDDVSPSSSAWASTASLAEASWIATMQSQQVGGKIRGGSGSNSGPAVLSGRR